MSAEQNEFANRELDREEIAMEEQTEPTGLPHFTVIDLDSPEGLEDTDTEFPAPQSIDELMQMLGGMFGQPQKSDKQKALEAILPMIDAGIDVMAMEGYVKTPEELRTVEGQMNIRGDLVDGVLAAFQALGIDMREARDAMLTLEQSGYPFKQEADVIAERLTVWDEVSIVNHLYGPRVAGEIFARRAEWSNDQSSSPDNG